MSKVYAFDVDHTLEVSSGPVSLDSVRELRRSGHVTGLCGNWAVVVCHDGWHELFSFLGPLSLTKSDFMAHLAQYIPADEYVMVGNTGDVPGQSSDANEARLARWRFIKESDFAGGQR